MYYLYNMRIDGIIERTKELKGQHFVYVLDLGKYTKFGVSSSLGRRMIWYKNRFETTKLVALFKLNSQDSTYFLENHIKRHYKNRVVKGLEYIDVPAVEVAEKVLEIGLNIKDQIKNGSAWVPNYNLGTTRVMPNVSFDGKLLKVKKYIDTKSNIKTNGYTKQRPIKAKPWTPPKVYDQIVYDKIINKPINRTIPELIPYPNRTKGWRDRMFKMLAA